MIEINNMLLCSMLGTNIDYLRPHLERITFDSETTLARSGDFISHVFFMDQGSTGILVTVEGGRPLASGLIGGEGLIGWQALLGSECWPCDVLVRDGGGAALRIGVAELKQACAESPALFLGLLRFVPVFMLQMERTIASSLLHSLERRLARWLLMLHDRVAGNELRMTHREIAIKLGVRRASVTDVLHVLEGERAIGNVRGRIVIRDRDRLERLAGGCYGEAEAAYRAAIGPFGKGAPTPEARPVAIA